MKPSEYKRQIPKEKFKIVERDNKIFDAKFETKSITYLQDAWIRFKKNKASVVASYMLLVLILYAVIAPFFSKYDLAFSDAVYAKARPKLQILERSGYWDGTSRMKLNDKYFAYVVGMGAAAEAQDGRHVTWEEAINSKFSPIVSYEDPQFDSAAPKGKSVSDTRFRYASVDSYYFVGFKYLVVDMKKFEEIRKYEQDNDIKIIYPMIDRSHRYANKDDADANAWFLEKKGMPCDENGKTLTIEDLMEKGFSDSYLRDENGNVRYYLEKDKSMVQIRVLYYNYYRMVNGIIPSNVFGVDPNGNDIFVRMAHAIRLSLALSISVSIINFFLGTMYGAVAGFYGGWVDMILERLTDILSGMPFIIVATLFQLHFVKTGKVSVFGGLLFAFILTGWIGVGARTRTQFYRFKKQEYILAAQTLGASDWRLMFKHIYPNALGTIVTATAFIIPNVILSESSLSYLGIVNFHGKDMASLGTMLGTARAFLKDYPHILFFPAAVISIMMISFNLFSNGLRDAFNPSLRGVDE